MALLQVKDFPADVYEKISAAAREEQQTIAQETIALIQRGLRKEELDRERRRLLLEICEARIIPDAAKAIDDAALVREDRRR